MEGIYIGDILIIDVDGKIKLLRVILLFFVFVMVIVLENCKDEVKMSSVLIKLLEEDLVLIWE